MKSTMDEPVKCACPSCCCPVPPGQEVVREGRTYCSETCAYECTEQTCLCVHDRCEGQGHKHDHDHDHQH